MSEELPGLGGLLWGARPLYETNFQPGERADLFERNLNFLARLYGVGILPPLPPPRVLPFFVRPFVYPGRRRLGSNPHIIPDPDPRINRTPRNPRSPDPGSELPFGPYDPSRRSAL